MKYAATTTLTAMIGLVGLMVVGGLSGCQQYVSSPGVPSAKGVPENPNKPAALSCMVEATRYVATRYPPGGYVYDAESAAEQGAVQAPYALLVNGPQGLRRSFYVRLAEGVGSQAEPMTPDNQGSGLPVFYVDRVWLRFNSATVDVIRPMPEVGPGPDGKPVYQTVTVRLEGGTTPWRVVHARAWPAGATTLPTAYFLPDEERVDQFEVTMMGEGQGDGQGGDAIEP